MKKKLAHWLTPFTLILLIASWFRLVNLDNIPYGFHNDELMNGYVGKFILTNGQDLYGNHWPILYFDNFGDYPNVIPMYLSGIFAYFLGNSQIAVRLPIAFAGIATVGLVYWICRWIWEDQRVAFLTSLSLAVLPWHVVLSRATAEGITATFIWLLGLTIIMKAIDQKRKGQFLLGTVLLFFTYFLYPGFRLLTPLSSLGLIWFSAKTKRSWKIATIFFVIVLFMTTGLISQTNWGRGRYEQTSLFTHNQFIAGKAVRYPTALGDGHVLAARFFHNKLVLAGQEIMHQYLSYFSPQFWFSATGLPGRYSIPEHGVMLYAVCAILVLAIFWQFLRPLNKKNLKTIFFENHEKYFFVYLWAMLVAAIPATLTLEDVPNIHRSAPLGVMLMWPVGLSIAIVLKQIASAKKQQIFIFGWLLILGLEILFFWHYYTNLSYLTTKLFRGEEDRSLVLWLSDHQNQFQNILVTDAGTKPIRYLFYKNDYSSQLANNFSRGMKISLINNLLFIDDKCYDFIKTGSIDPNINNMAVVVRAECGIAKNYSLIDKIYYLDQTQAYLIVKAD